MIITIDSGNTTISLALMKGTRVLKRVNVGMIQTRQNIAKELNSCLENLMKDYPGIKEVVLCSVVPEIIASIKKIIKRTTGMHTLIIGQDFKVPIVNNYKKPLQVGQDRLVCAFAAKELYGHPIIVLDSGTAITIDVVSVAGSYEGGIIVPGIRLSAEALYHKTALLPKIENIKWPRRLIGKDTEESILSGLFHGYAAMCSGIIDRLKSEIGRKTKVIATGGYASLLKKDLSAKIDLIDPDLVFKGLRLICDHAKFKNSPV